MIDILGRRCSLAIADALGGAVFCPRFGFHIYEAWLIERRETIKLYIACVTFYLALIMYVCG